MIRTFKSTVIFVIQYFKKFLLNTIYIIQIRSNLLRRDDSISKLYKLNIKKYYQQYNVKVSYLWHKYYSSRNDLEDVRYIPENLFYSEILPIFNRLEFKKAYSDKSLHNIFFPSIKRPITIAKNISGVLYDDNLNRITLDNCIKKCEERKSFIIKPTIDSGGGRDVTFVETKNNKEAIIRTIKKYKENYIIQEIIEQHRNLAVINKESVNTIRVISLFYEEKVYILSSVLRMGVNGAKVDNSSAGGISCGINFDGKLKKYAYDKYGNKMLQHPQGFIFENKDVPSYNEIINTIKLSHQMLPYFGIVSWDFAVDQINKPILIEYNLGYQEINFHQLNNGPLFGELTDNILKYVAERRRNK